jgi:hypothetical protein
MFIIFFDIKGIIHKVLILEGLRVNSAYYCDILHRLHENLRRLRPELWQQQKIAVASRHTQRLTVSFSTREFLTNNTVTVVSTHPNFLFLQMNIKWKVRNFDILEAIEAQSQAVSNTLREHDFQGAFKKMEESRKQCIRAEGDYFEGDGGQEAHVEYYLDKLQFIKHLNDYSFISSF